MKKDKKIIIGREIIFVDTGAFFAIKNKKDECYKKAVLYKNKLLSQGNRFRLVTTKPIMYETLNLGKKKLKMQDAIELGEMFYNTKYIEIYDIEEEIEKQGWEIFKKYSDQKFSFTDCTSFAFMKAKRIKKAFAFDNHFLRFGFEMIK